MKDFKKIIWLLIIGLFTAVLLYPTLHELGHSLTTILLGGKILEFHLFPLPNMLCDGSSVGEIGLVIIGLSGMLIPFFVSLLLNPKPFLLWYISQLIKCISVLAFGISLMSLLGKGYGFSISNDDIITVLKYWPEGNDFCIATIISLLFMALYSIYRQRPLKRLYCYLGIKS